MAIAAKHKPTRKNYLLASLEGEELKRVLALIKPVEFDLGHVIYEAGDKMDYAYFPTTAIVSLLYIMEDGATAEIGIVGNDGMLGVTLFLGGDSTSSRAVVQSAGMLCRMKAEDLRAEFKRGGRFQDLLLRYTQALLTQISQRLWCNRLHAVRQQLAVGSFCHDRLHMISGDGTHDLISNS